MTDTLFLYYIKPCQIVFFERNARNNVTAETTLSLLQYIIHNHYKQWTFTNAIGIKYLRPIRILCCNQRNFGFFLRDNFCHFSRETRGRRERGRGQFLTRNKMRRQNAPNCFLKVFSPHYHRFHYLTSLILNRGPRLNPRYPTDLNIFFCLAFQDIIFS